jgi:hypothetical protein
MAGRNFTKDILVALAGLLGLIYLINPTAGIFELIPDNLPFVGNLDEAAACALILAAFRYYDIDLTAFLGRGVKGRNPGGDAGGSSPN